MQLPYGTLASSHNGSADLKELGEAIAKDGLTGYLRVSVFDRSAVKECVVVYMTGRAVMAFASEGDADRKDPDCRQIAAAIARDDAIVEICKLQDKQVRLLLDIYREFAIAPPAPAAAAPKPAPKEPPKEPPRTAPPAPKPEARIRAATMPEIRGRFIRVEEIGSLDEYLRKHPGETGHLLLMTQQAGKTEENHVILIRGRIEAAYNGAAAGPELLDKLNGVPGQAEFYAVDEAVLSSIIGRQARSASPPAPAPVAAAERPARGVGIPAKDLLEGVQPLPATTRDDINRTVDEISGGMEDDIAMVRRVERDFASHVDELLCKLELSHLRARKKR